MAPFAPFISETTFQNLTTVSPVKRPESVHLESFPETNSKLVQPALEEAVKVMEALVMLGRNHREKIKVKGKIPLNRMRILHRDSRVLTTLKKFEPYFQEELNIRNIEYSTDEDTYVQVTAKANFPVLGKRVGTKMKEVAGAIQKLSLDDLLKLENGGTILAAGEPITLGDVEIRRAAKGNNPNVATQSLVSFEVDPTVLPDQLQEGLAREILRKIQQARKNADLQLDQRIHLELGGPELLHEAVQAHLILLKDEALALELKWVSEPHGKFVEKAALDEGELSIAITPSI